jgi:hypothetical protein
MATKQPVISLKRTGGVLEEGVYRLSIDSMELKQGQVAPYFALKLKVHGKSTIVYENISTAEAARFRMEAFLDAIQAPTDGAMTAPKLISFCRGKSFFANLGNESYNGKLKNVIAQYLLPEVASQVEVQNDAIEEEDDEDTEEEIVDWDEDEDGDDEDDDDQPAMPF